MKPKAKSKVREITLTAVGLHYRLTKTKLQKLEENIPLQAQLRREPENEYDENAIAVYVTEKPFANVKIGYLKKEIAHDLAPKMDDGTFEPHEVWVAQTYVSKREIGGEGHIAELLVKL